jgi:hypothetical protein
LSGPPWWVVRATAAWAIPFVLKWGAFDFGLFVGFKWGFPSLFKGTPTAFPDSSPPASVGLPLRLPQMLEPADRTFFPPGLANAFREAASADPRV